MTALFDKESIKELLPQRPPMMMVDAFYGIEAEKSFAGLRVEEDNIFVECGELCEEGLIEHMAQSAAARAGYLSKLRGGEVKLGFIGSVNGFCAGWRPRTGESILTSVEMVEEVMNIALIEIESRIGEETIARCRMKIYTEQ